MQNNQFQLKKQFNNRRKEQQLCSYRNSSRNQKNDEGELDEHSLFNGDKAKRLAPRLRSPPSSQILSSDTIQYSFKNQSNNKSRNRYNQPTSNVLNFNSHSQNTKGDLQNDNIYVPNSNQQGHVHCRSYSQNIKQLPHHLFILPSSTPRSRLVTTPIPSDNRYQEVKQVSNNLKKDFQKALALSTANRHRKLFSKQNMLAQKLDTTRSRSSTCPEMNEEKVGNFNKNNRFATPRIPGKGVGKGIRSSSPFLHSTNLKSSHKVLANMQTANAKDVRESQNFYHTNDNEQQSSSSLSPQQKVKIPYFVTKSSEMIKTKQKLLKMKFKIQINKNGPILESIENSIKQDVVSFSHKMKHQLSRLGDYSLIEFLKTQTGRDGGCSAGDPSQVISPAKSVRISPTKQAKKKKEESESINIVLSDDKATLSNAQNAPISALKRDHHKEYSPCPFQSVIMPKLKLKKNPNKNIHRRRQQPQIQQQQQQSTYQQSQNNMLLINRDKLLSSCITSVDSEAIKGIKRRKLKEQRKELMFINRVYMQSTKQQ